MSLLTVALDTNNHGWRIWGALTSARAIADNSRERTYELRAQLGMFTPDEWDRDNVEFMTCVRDLITLTKQMTIQSFRYTFIRGIYDYIFKFKPDDMLLAVDDRGGTWRHKFFPDYKGSRVYIKPLVYPKNHAINKVADPETGDLGMGVFNCFTPDEFFEVYREILITLKRTMGHLKIIRLPDIEADDIIASLVKLTATEGNKVIGISNDGDYVQLLRYPNFRLYHPIKRAFVTSSDPVRDLSHKIIIGDKSDNIPNMQKGIGKKYANDLLDCVGRYEGGLSGFWATNQPAKEQYMFNKRLIDMELIPTEIHNKCIGSYISYIQTPCKPSEWRDYCVKYRMQGLLNSHVQFCSAVRKLV